MAYKDKIVVGITQGDTNGIGYEVIIKALSDARILENCVIVLYGSSRFFGIYRKFLPEVEQIATNVINAAEDARTKRINIINAVPESMPMEIGQPTADGAKAAILAAKENSDLPVFVTFTFDKDGKLLNYKSPESAELAGPVDADGAFTPIRISAMVIAVHNDKIKEPPRSWKDLLDPKYKGKIAMPNPKAAATALATVAALKDKYGWEYWEKLKENGVVVSKTQEMREKFAHGEYPIIINMEENALKQKMSQGVNTTIIYPEEGSVLVPGYIGILKDTKNPEGAKKLVDWWLSREGQSAMSLAYMHPVKYGVREPAGAQDINNLRIHSLSVNWNKLAVEEKMVKEKFAEIMK